MALLCFLLLDNVGQTSPHQPAPLAQNDGERVTLTVTLLSGGKPLQMSEGATAVQGELSLLRSELAARGGREFVLEKATSITPSQPSQVVVGQGDYLLIVRVPGYARKVQALALQHDQQLTIELDAAVTREVRVLVDQGEEHVPLANATVLLGQSEAPWGALTQADGRARFNDVPGGPLLVQIYAPGYQPYRAMTEGDLLVRLRPASVTVIRVLDGKKPVEGAEVVVSGVQLWPARSVLTRENGEIAITGLEVGSYSVYAKKGSRISAVRHDLTVRDERGRDELELELGPGSFVVAEVISDVTEKPIASARVSVSTAGLGQFVIHGQTGSDGRVRLGPLLERSGFVQARAAGYVTQSARFPVAAEPDAAEELAVGGETSVVLRLAEAGTIVGRVVDARGFPISGVSVEAVGVGTDRMPYSITVDSEAVTDAHFDWANAWEHGTQNRMIPAGELGVMLGPVPPIPLADLPIGERAGRLTSDDRGYFIIRGVPPGRGVVLARHPSYMDGKSPELVLAPGAQVETEIVLGQGEALRGRLLDHDGFPVAQARISVVGDGFERKIFTESDGNFELLAAPEKVSLRISTPDNLLRVVLVHDVTKAERGEKLKIELPTPREEVDLLVQSEAGEPLPLAQVTLVSLAADEPLKITRFTQEDGHVRFEQAAGLQVRLSLDATGYVVKRVEQRLNKEQTIRLTKSLSAVGKVTGVRGRHAAAGATVMFRGGGVERKVMADALGEYRIEGLPQGSGVLVATHPEYGKKTQAVQIRPGVGSRAMELPTLDLNPTIIVQGKVVDEQGRSVAFALVGAERLSAYVSHRGGAQVLATCDGAGNFEVEVEPTAQLYLYAAQLGQAFGFSDAIDVQERDRIDDVQILVDHQDQSSSYEPATVLITLEQRGGQLVIYAVAAASEAARAGLLPEDLLLSVDGQDVSSVEQARELLTGSLGYDVRLEVRRGSSRKTFVISRESFLH